MIDPPLETIFKIYLNKSLFLPGFSYFTQLGAKWQDKQWPDKQALLPIVLVLKYQSLLFY